MRHCREFREASGLPLHSAWRQRFTWVCFPAAYWNMRRVQFQTSCVKMVLCYALKGRDCGAESLIPKNRTNPQLSQHSQFDKGRLTLHDGLSRTHPPEAGMSQLL